VFQRLVRVIGIEGLHVPFVDKCDRERIPRLVSELTPRVAFALKFRIPVSSRKGLMVPNDFHQVRSNMWRQDVGGDRTVTRVAKDLADVVQQGRQDHFFVCSTSLGPGGNLKCVVQFAYFTAITDVGQALKCNQHLFSSSPRPVESFHITIVRHPHGQVAGWRPATASGWPTLSKYRGWVAEEITNVVGALAERYLYAVAGQDWGTVTTCLSAGVVRRGPFGDDFEGVGEYVSFLHRTMPSLPGYQMDIDRITELGDNRALVELRETIVLDTGPLVTNECLIFALGNDGLLAEIAIYLRKESPS